MFTLYQYERPLFGLTKELNDLRQTVGLCDVTHIVRFCRVSRILTDGGVSSCSQESLAVLKSSNYCSVLLMTARSSLRLHNGQNQGGLTPNFACDITITVYRV